MEQTAQATEQEGCGRHDGWGQDASLLPEPSFSALFFSFCAHLLVLRKTAIAVATSRVSSVTDRNSVLAAACDVGESCPPSRRCLCFMSSRQPLPGLRHLTADMESHSSRNFRGLCCPLPCITESLEGSLVHVVARGGSSAVK